MNDEQELILSEIPLRSAMENMKFSIPKKTHSIHTVGSIHCPSLAILRYKKKIEIHYYD